jgi:hypothetical protein
MAGGVAADVRRHPVADRRLRAPPRHEKRRGQVWSNNEGRGMLRCEQSSAVQRFGTVDRPPFTGARGNLPLPAQLRGAILGSKPERSGECRVYWIRNAILAALVWHGIWQFKV